MKSVNSSLKLAVTKHGSGTRGGTTYILDAGHAIMKGIKFKDFGIWKSIDFHDLDTKNE